MSVPEWRRCVGADYERDWHEAKSEFGTAMAKMGEALRAAEQRELVALAERDEAIAATEKLGLIAKMLVAHGCDCSEMSSNFDCERCFACKLSDALGELT